MKNNNFFKLALGQNPCGPNAPLNRNVQLIEEVFNTDYTINLTVTFKPSYRDVATMGDCQISLSNFLDSHTKKNKLHKHKDNHKFISKWYFVSEWNKDLRRKHVHGQLLIDKRAVSESELSEISDFLFSSLSKKFGRSTPYWNSTKSNESIEYDTYTAYCLKEQTFNIISLQENNLPFFSSKNF